MNNSTTATAMNTTSYNITVTLGDKTYTPTMHIADNGRWKITGHGSLQSDLTKDQYADWLCDLWADLRDIDTEG